MKKFVISIFGFVALFLLTFSTYRVVNGGEPITLHSFLNILGDLNFDFENLARHYLEFENKISIDTGAMFAPFPSFNNADIFTFFESLGIAITEFFNRISIFFNLVYDFFNLFIWFVYDTVVIIANILKMFLGFLGIKTRF